MTAKQFKLPLAVHIAIFLICAAYWPIFLLTKAIKKIRRKTLIIKRAKNITDRNSGEE